SINDESSGSGYDELVSNPVFITDNRAISITDTQIPLIDNATITRVGEWLGIGKEYEIRLSVSEPLSISDPNSVYLILKTGPSSTDKITMESSMESSVIHGITRANTVMVFKNTVKSGDKITIPEITTFSGSILDTASNSLNVENLTNMSFSASPNLDGVKPQEISASVEGGVAAYKGQGVFYGGIISNDNVTLTLNAVDQDNGSGISGFYIALDNTSFGSLDGSENGWFNLSSSNNGSLSNHQVSFDLGLGDDNKTVFVAFKDHATPPNIASTYDEISVAPRLISSLPDNASTSPSQTVLTLNFNKLLDNSTVSSSVTLEPDPVNARLYLPRASYSDNSSLNIRFQKALPDNGTSYLVTVHDNLTDSDGNRALDNLSFSFSTADIQTLLASYYSFDGYGSPTSGTDNLSLSSANLLYTTGLFNDSHGAVQFSNASNTFSLAGDYSISFWVKGSSGEAFGYSPSNEWKHVVVMGNGNAFVDTQSVSFTTSTNLSGFTGELDELKIFNTLLESSQIEELYINPRRGLIAYYPFSADNGSSFPLLDFSGRNNDLMGSPSVINGFSGFSKAARGSIITPVFNQDNYSISVWVQSDSWDNASVVQIGNNVVFSVDKGSLSASGTIISGPYLPEKYPNHLVLTRSGTTGILYHSGQAYSINIPALSDNITLGGGDVSLAEIRIYDRALSSSEVLSLMGIIDTQPPSGSLEISSTITEPFAGFFSTVDLNFHFKARDDSGVLRAKFGDQADNLSMVFELDNVTLLDNVTRQTLSDNSTEGTRTIYVQLEDSKGLKSSVFTDNITLDLLPPFNAKIIINDNNTFPVFKTGSLVKDNKSNSGENPFYTNSIHLKLHLSAQDNISIKGWTLSPASDNASDPDNVTNVKDFTKVYDNQSVAYTLDQSGDDGIKTIQVTFQDEFGRTASASDNITLDRQRPIGSVRVADNSSAVKATDNVTLVLEATDELSGVAAYAIQWKIGDATPVQPSSVDNFTAFAEPGKSVSENKTENLSQIIGDNLTDNLTFYAWFLDQAGNISSSLTEIASEKNHDDSSGGSNDNVSVSPAFDRLFVDNIAPTGSIQFDNMTGFDNTTVLLSLSLQDDHALYAFWKSDNASKPNINDQTCVTQNLTDDESDCWQELTDNDSILNPVWTDNNSGHTGLKTFSVSGIQHTLPTDNFTNNVSIYARDYAGNIALIGGESFTVVLNPIAITTSDNFSGTNQSFEWLS
ncbi:MAG: Ig-like domain-containing protein, partial [Candidatus Poseidoniia archaeon]|nr:Ig-like domain-containing protein [Candidatus Poseidoniia archaeon]